MIDIYGIGVIVSAIMAIIFTIKNDKEKMYVSLMILFFILLLKFIIGK